MENSSNIAIITARGGSKRIPRKNIKLFLGKPILQYSIEAALNSNIFGEVMVSTEDEEIANLALKCGAKVPFTRSAKNSDDHASTADVIREVLLQYQAKGKTFENYCCIYPTAPFVTAQKLKLALGTLTKSSADAVVPVVRFGFPIQRALIIENEMLTFMDSRYVNTRSQDLKPTYHDCGQFYFGKTEKFLASGRVFPDLTLPLIMPETEVQDIDHQEDWLIAELKYKLLLENQAGATR
jgi:N-acylneuraminate cytidylyltransferase